MPNTKLSEETNGAPAVGTDIIGISRETSPSVYADFALTLSDLAALLGGGTTLAGLTDVYGTPSNGQVLTFDPDAGGGGVGSELPGWRPETPSTAGGNPGIINVSSSRVLILDDAWDTVVFTSAATLTIPADATTDFPLGNILSFAAVGGIGTLTAASGVTLNGRPAGTVDSDPPSTGTIPQFTLVKIAANTWVTSLEGVV
ncbi:MAG: hypothetical protein AAF183_13050 [Pseudomonadota bacterium]